MLTFISFFFVSFLSFAKKVFFLGFCLLFLRCFLVFFVWSFLSQWIGLVFFLVYITGVIVIFIFFCRFSRSVGGLIFNPVISLSFFFFFGVFNFFFSLGSKKKGLRKSAEFYFLRETVQLFFLGFWLVFTLWASLKIIKILGGAIR